MNYLQYLLRNASYYMYPWRSKGNKLHGAHIGLRRLTDKNKKTSFNWVNGNRVTFTAWESGQPSIADCTLTLFEYFNTESLWRTEDCLYNLVDFFVCEKPFLEAGNNTRVEIKEDECRSIYQKNDVIASPFSGKTCQNWRNLTHEADIDLDRKYPGLRASLNNSTPCIDPSSDGIPWCYVDDPDNFLLEPCVLHHKDTIRLPKTEVLDAKCSDGSSI
ncbi:uncharacterized protein LOC132723927, partial [Ruditapes philippinarum]|uniref:uncharacterized protein LOC132723927 n=1 Tax=Ruditapes philippinarum TaxID=129788 RepID=UPI00295BBF51